MKVICSSQSELVQAIKEWHQKQVEGLNLVVENEDADLDLGDELVMKAGTDKAKGFRLGIIIALNYLGKLPTFKSGDDDEVDDDSEAGRDDSQISAQIADGLVNAFSNHIITAGLSDGDSVTIRECKDALRHVIGQFASTGVSHE